MNNNIEETSVSFPVAKLLKEAGFDCPTREWRQEGDGISGDVTGKWGRYNSKGDVYTSLPTQQLAIDWIRVNWKIHISIHWTGIGGMVEEYKYQINRIDSLFSAGGKRYKTPEEAKEAAIEYCLTNLILKK